MTKKSTMDTFIKSDSLAPAALQGEMVALGVLVSALITDLAKRDLVAARDVLKESEVFLHGSLGSSAAIKAGAHMLSDVVSERVFSKRNI